jgi:hypothetical protein
VVIANPELAPAFTEKQLFNLLLSGLLNDYRITRITLDAQRSLSTYEKLDILKDEEERINNNRGVALYTKRSFNKPRGNRRFDNSDESDDRRLKCYLCGQCHKMESCQHL